jgi:hypothetical protein
VPSHERRNFRDGWQTQGRMVQRVHAELSRNADLQTHLMPLSILASSSGASTNTSHCSPGQEKYTSNGGQVREL